LLAFAAVLCFVIGMILLVQVRGLGHTSWRYVFSSAFLQLALLAFFFDPAMVGLHDFYRSRIARCFLGAGRGCDAIKNRATFEQDEDDLPLCDADDESRYEGRPVHLVCCAANNLAGDTLSSLYRGCRSAVLSPHGVSLGNQTAVLPKVRLSSALTASAAAFNSQMGRVSMRLGPAVAFIMSALNLRLGLWVPHPLNQSREATILPGRFFLYEMFGVTHAGPLSAYQAPGPFTSLLSSTDYLHLSDGAHFENLGLYELVRRHCRYIIVSDCSADPQVDFDDLANALRCVREDFGVEVDLDTTPLLPSGPGNRSAQHAVVGTIHYDGLAGTDKGTILYIKPTLTGDESPDVLQYQSRNRAFPHESTGDQFYDEAQWESYRRLGEHAANAILRFFETKPHKDVNFVENLFLYLSQRWHPTPSHQEELFLHLTERCASLEAKVLEAGPVSLRNEFFPEIENANGESEKAAQALEPADESKVVYFVMLAAQAMEDAWLGADLENYWSHPLNQGWMAYFQRWASTPSFRRWWPVIRPLYSANFADFVKDRFNIRLRDPVARNEPPGPGAELTLLGPISTNNPCGMAWQHWRDRYPVPDCTDKQLLTYNLALESAARQAESEKSKPIQVAFLLYIMSNNATGARTVAWTTSQFYVPSTLIGAGITARFLDAVLQHFKREKVQTIEIILAEDGHVAGKEELTAPLTKPARSFKPDPGNRMERVHTIDFYKSRGFAYVAPGPNGELCKLSLDMENVKEVIPHKTQSGRGSIANIDPQISI
jgi:hypothetical protein